MGFRFHVGPVSWGPSRSAPSKDDGIFGMMIGALVLTASLFPVLGAVAIGIFIYRTEISNRVKYFRLALAAYLVLVGAWALAMWRSGFDMGQGKIAETNELVSSFEYPDNLFYFLMGGAYFSLWLFLAALVVGAVYLVSTAAKKLWRAI